MIVTIREGARGAVGSGRVERGEGPATGGGEENVGLDGERHPRVEPGFVSIAGPVTEDRGPGLLSDLAASPTAA